MRRDELVAYLDDYLRLAEFADYGPQGLQVEGRQEVTTLTLSVDAALPVLQAAIAGGSHFHLAHHGIFWGEAQLLRGALGRQVRALMQADVNLYASHLALDAHPEVGNNVVLARMLQIEVTDWWAKVKGNPIGVLGQAPAGTRRDALLSRLNQELGIEAQLAAHGPEIVDRVAIVSGGAAAQIQEAAELGVDTFLTGEAVHAHYWDAAAHNINVIYAGHYATETVGVQTLGRHLASQFGLEVQFLDFPTGL